VLAAFTQRTKTVDVNLGVATTDEMAALVQERLADVAIGPELAGLDSEPVMRYRLSVVASPSFDVAAKGARWLVGPTGADSRSDVGELLASCRVSADRVSVFASDAAAWAAATAGEGLAPAVEHLVNADVARGSLVRVAVPGCERDRMWHVTTGAGDRRSPGASKLRHFLRTPEAMQAMYRADSGVPPSRFRPPVYVTLWS
jgi:DNA-binding transcriptional LysR family regulator